MRTDLAEDPAVMRMANELDLDLGLGPGLPANLRRSLIVGCLHRLWSYADQHTVDGRLKGAAIEDVDRIAGVVGFAALLKKVGWLKITKTAVIFPHWDRHNGKSGKARALAARRASRCRHARGVTSGAPTSSSYTEKRREEHHPLTGGGGSASGATRSAGGGVIGNDYFQACRRLEGEGVGQVAIRSLGPGLTLAQVERAIANADAAKGIKNRPGYVVEAIRSGFELTRAAKRQQADQEATRARQARAAAERAAWQPFWAWWGTLSHAQRVEAVDKATSKMAKQHHRDAVAEVERDDSQLAVAVAKAVRQRWRRLAPREERVVTREEKS